MALNPKTKQLDKQIRDDLRTLNTIKTITEDAISRGIVPQYDPTQDIQNLVKARRLLIQGEPPDMVAETIGMRFSEFLKIYI